MTESHIIGDYQIIGDLIKSSNQCYLASKNNKLYVVKKASYRESLLSLIPILSHPNLMKVKIIDEEYSVSRMAHYDMLCLLNSFSSLKFQLFDVLDIMNQAIKAVSYLHLNNYVHRDIKPDNFVIIDNRPVNIISKLMDYDYLIKVDHQNDVESFFGSPGYQPPESMNGSQDLFKVDAYQLGVTLKFIIETYGYYEFSPEQVNMVERLLLDDPEQRLSVLELLESDVFLPFDYQDDFLVEINPEELAEVIQDIREGEFPIFSHVSGYE